MLVRAISACMVLSVVVMVWKLLARTGVSAPPGTSPPPTHVLSFRDEAISRRVASENFSTGDTAKVSTPLLKQLADEPGIARTLSTEELQQKNSAESVVHADTKPILHVEHIGRPKHSGLSPPPSILADRLKIAAKKVLGLNSAVGMEAESSEKHEDNMNGPRARSAGLKSVNEVGSEAGDSSKDSEKSGSNEIMQRGNDLGAGGADGAGGAGGAVGAVGALALLALLALPTPDWTLWLKAFVQQQVFLIKMLQARLRAQIGIF